MPVHLLTDLERAKLNQFPEEIPEESLTAYYSLSLADLFLIREQRGDHQQLGFALQLATLRYLGFCPEELTQAPQNVVEYLARQLKLDPASLKDYGTRLHTRRDHLLKIYAHLDYRHLNENEAATVQLNEWLLARALEHDAPTVLFRLTLEKLKAEKIVRPGLSVVERLVAAAREKAQKHTFEQLAGLLTEPCQSFLDKLLVKDADLKTSRLEWLRQASVSNSPEAILSSLAKLTYLREQGVAEWDLSMLNPNRRKFLASLGKRTSPQALSTAVVERRYPILVAFLSQAVYELTDETIEMFDTYLAGAYSRSKRELDDFKLKVAQALNETAYYFRQMGRVVLDPDVLDTQVRQAIYQKLPQEQLLAAVEECDKLVRPLDDECFDFLAERYTTIRHFAPELLEGFVFRANSASTSLLEAIQVLKQVNQENKRRIPGSAPLSFVSPKWDSYIYEPNGRINRKYYELAVLWELRQALRAGNIWVEGSRRYAKLESYLIPQTKWPELSGEVYEMLNLPRAGVERLKAKGVELEKLLFSLHQHLTSGEKGPGQLRMEDGELIVPPLEAAENKPSVIVLKELIRKRLPKVELVDLLVEVDMWTSYSSCFKHAGGLEQAMPDLLIHLYAAVLAQACNLTLASIGRMTDLSARKISWCASWYLRPETIKEAVTTIVNYQYHQPLAQNWGDGTRSSSDGQRFPVKVQTRNAAALPRYFAFGKGLTMYNWSSDILVQYDSRVVPTTMRDATIILDAILDNETELLIADHTSDTAGFTHLVFGLFDLLGIQFSPRIRDIGDQQLSLVGGTAEYGELAPLFKGNIRQDLIIKHWDELIRLVGSLKLGWVPASLMISKLQSFPRQNALAQALMEYGKLCKTLFILRSLQSEQTRHHNENQLNKGENLNGLREVIFFGQHGQLRKRQLEEQNNQASCLNLVVNCVVVWNTVYMTAVVEQLRKEGQTVLEEDLAHIWPTRTEHLNVYGKYHFNLEEATYRQKLRPLRQPEQEAEADLD